MNDIDVADDILDNYNSIVTAECENLFDINTILLTNENAQNMTILHYNIRSLRANFDELCINVNKFNEKRNIVAVSMLECNIELDNYNLNIIGVYRPNPTNTQVFIEDMDDYLNKLIKNDISVIIGDVNIDINPNNKLNTESLAYTNMLTKNGFLQQISVPTRIDGDSATTIDHIATFVNNISESKVKFNSLVLHNSLTDHYPLFYNIEFSELKPETLRTASQIKINQFDESCNYSNQRDKFQYLLSYEVGGYVLPDRHHIVRPTISCTMYGIPLKLTAKYANEYDDTMPPKRSREEILRRKREAEKTRMLKIKNDPIKLAEYKEKEKQKYLKKIEKGQRKRINQMTDREKRSTRRKWREYSSTYRQKKVVEHHTENFMRETTPPLSDNEPHPENIPHIADRRAQEAKRRSWKQRKLRNRQIKQKDAYIFELKKKIKSQRQKYKRLKEKTKNDRKVQISPKTQIENMAKDPKQHGAVVKKAIFGEVLKMQIEQNYVKLKRNEEKATFKKTITGKLTDKYKLWRFNSTAVTYKKTGHNLTTFHKKNQKLRLQKMVQEFLEDDSNSRQTAGKKEFVTRNKIRKQKRYILDTLRRLHEKFVSVTASNISYALFCRLRPFWIVPASLKNHDTCACLVHENIDLKLNALKCAKILPPVDSHQKLLETLCCDRYNETCLERTCDACCVKALRYSEFNNASTILCKQWTNKREVITDNKTNMQRFITKYRKETIQITPRDLILELEHDLKTFFRHVFNMVHQYNSIRQMKESLTEMDAIIHMDFSENYSTKYNKEIQAFHFGGSRTQISLHTVVLYLKGATSSHCTISSNLSHGAGSIWAHLKPVLATLPSTVENIHFLSDGPVSQYRNKSMFYVLGCKLEKMYPNVSRYSWNYHEAGHGKGAPDGVGATCKRTADEVIARGGDIANLEQFAAVVRERCPSIYVSVIDEQEIEKMNAMINEDSSKLVAFKGTLSVYQVTGSVYFPNQLVMKSLSCFCNSDGCEHYKLGCVKYKQPIHPDERLNISTVYTDSEDDNLPLSSYIVNNPRNKIVQDTDSEDDNLPLSIWSNQTFKKQ
ncbi:unnamed protein product, partial [Callosobruchus maculatus]